MSNFYVPYAGSKPASLSINGHRLVIISADRNELEENLSLLGADHFQELDDWGSRAEQEASLETIASSVGGGVVVAPEDLELREVIKNLETELPWIQ